MQSRRNADLRAWCGRPELNRHGQSPTDFLTNYGFHRRQPQLKQLPFVVWTIPSPCLGSRFRCCPSSLYTFPRRHGERGLARDCHVKGFPEFEQFCCASFPTRTQESDFPKSAASTCSATPAHCGTLYIRSYARPRPGLIENNRLERLQTGFDCHADRVRACPHTQRL